MQPMAAIARNEGAFRVAHAPYGYGCNEGAFRVAHAPYRDGGRHTESACYLALDAAGGPGEAFKKFLGHDVIVGRELHQVGFELGLEILNGLLDFAIDD